jgi:hypothetical protein
MKDIVIFKGYRHKGGIVHFRNITLDDLRAIFFPKNFYEVYSYLGSVPYSEDGDVFQAIEPLIIFLDYKAKPKYCPRWVLRLLHVFGKDKSIVRVRNWRLYNLFLKLTKGFSMMDYKTKWTHYDLRLSVVGTDQVHELSEAIESAFYKRGKAQELYEQIKKLDPETKVSPGHGISYLEGELDKLLVTDEK